MTYSYTQLSQYLACPRRYRYRYLDGWREKDTRAAMLFGRAFEQALSAYFQREDPGVVLFREWALYQNSKLEYPQRHELGSHAAARHPTARALRPRRPCPCPPTPQEP